MENILLCINSLSYIHLMQRTTHFNTIENFSSILSSDGLTELILLHTHPATPIFECLVNYLGRIRKCGLVEGGVLLGVGLEVSKPMPVPVSLSLRAA